MAILSAFNFLYPNIVNVLKTPTIIRDKFYPDTQPIILGPNYSFDSIDNKKSEFLAIWDTGASGTVITKKVAEHVNVPIQTYSKCYGAYGDDYELRPVYYVTIHLPNNVCIVDVQVSEGEPKGCDILIGMDIISGGNLCVTNFSGRTNFSFCFPSHKRIDFVKEVNLLNAQKNKKAQKKKNTQKKKKKRRN